MIHGEVWRVQEGRSDRRMATLRRDIPADDALGWPSGDRAVASALLVALVLLSTGSCSDGDSPSLSQCVQDGGLGC